MVAWPGLAGDDTRGYSQGIAYVLLAAAGVSIGNVAIKRLTAQADPIMAMGFQLLIGAAPLALLSMLTEDVSLLTWSPEFLLVLVALAVLIARILALVRGAGAGLAQSGERFHVPCTGPRADDRRRLFQGAARDCPHCGCRPGAKRYLAGAEERRFILSANGNK